MNPDWIRWIKASLGVHFTEALDPLYLWIEGTNRQNDTVRTHAELRIDGPYVTELSKGYWKIEVCVDILVVHKIDNEDMYTIDRAVGNVLAAFTTDISVFKLGTGQDDDPMTQLGCLSLDPKDKTSIIVTNFGQPRIDSQVLQQSVEATYRMNLRT